MRALVLAILVVACGEHSGSIDVDGAAPDGSFVAEVDPMSVLLAGPPTDKRCIIMTGDSNCGGVGDTTELTGDDVAYASAYAPILMSTERVPTWGGFPPVWITYSLQTLQPHLSAGINAFGFELTMMRDIVAARPHTRWVLIKASIGGTSLHSHWKPSLDPYLFKNVHDWIDTQVAALGCTPAAYVQVLGGVDAESTSPANAYQTNMGAFATSMRSRYGANLPYVFGRVNANAEGAFTSTVRTKMAAYAASDVHSVMVDMDSGTLRAGNVHYTSASYLALGHDYATAVLSAVPP